MVLNISDTTLKAVKVPQGVPRVFVYDKSLHGFGAVVSRRGWSYFVEYAPPESTRRKRRSIGRLPMKAAQAREIAIKILAATVGRDAVDPLAPPPAGITYAEWVKEDLGRIKRERRATYQAELYLRGGRGGRGHAPTDSDAWSRWETRRLDEISSEDVQAWFDALSVKGKVAANRALAELRASLNRAVAMGKLASNPAERVRPNRETIPPPKRLTEDQRQRIAETIARMPVLPKTFFTLVRCTGARPSEALRAKWQDIDFETATWIVPRPKASRHPRRIPLTLDVLNAIRELPRLSEWLFPGKDLTKPRLEVGKWWDRLRREAGLPPTVTLYSFRHDFALRAARLAGPQVAAVLLGHSSVAQAVERYARLLSDDDDVRRVAELVAGGEGTVLPMRRGR